MKLLYGLPEHEMLSGGVAATIGNFDGVHLGHRKLLLALKREALKRGLPTLVLLFEPQPGEFFHKQDSPPRLFSLRDKLQALSSIGIDYVYCLRFNVRLAMMSAIEFAEQLIFEKLQVKYLLLGSDFRFGRHRQGGVELLDHLGKKYQCNVEIFPEYILHGERISSSRIRQLLNEGLLDKAVIFMGRPYSVNGRVIIGRGLGRQLGFPTANIALKKRKIPISGVFAVDIIRNDGSKYIGIANIGYKPTVSTNHKLSVEVHLFDFHGSLYGERIQVIFRRKVRDEMKFSGVSELVSQIHRDIESVRQEFNIKELGL